MQTNISEDYIGPDLPRKCTYDKDHVRDNPHSIPIRNAPQKIFPNILHCIGNTPLIKLNRIPQSLGIKCDVLVKCEFLNPGGSVKDRISYSMARDAENRGLLKPGSVMIEPTSGNAGIALAMVGAVKGYDCVLVLPEKSSNEKEDILKALGGKVVRTSDKIPYYEVGGIFSKPKEIQKETPNSIILHQFHNAANPLSHYYGTSSEILEDCDGKVDMVVMGVGTGGTMSGIGRRFKEILPDCLVVGVDPYGSTIAEPSSINETDVTYFEIEGIGHNYIPTTLDRSVADFWIKISDKESLNMARRLHKEEGLLCGSSSGTILCGALKAAKSLKEGQKCVVILPDGVGNYLSKFVSDYWMELRNFIPCQNTFNHWWWDHKVSLLKPTVELTVLNTSTCQDVLNIFNSQNRTLLPVVDNHNHLKGMVTAKDLMKRLLNLSVKPNDSIEKIISEKYATVTPNSNFGILSRILDNEGVAFVVDQEKDPNRKFLGALFPTDFLQYISENRQ